jgi:hypothetical protein
MQVLVGTETDLHLSMDGFLIDILIKGELNRTCILIEPGKEVDQ